MSEWVSGGLARPKPGSFPPTALFSVPPTVSCIWLSSPAVFEAADRDRGRELRRELFREVVEARGAPKLWPLARKPAEKSIVMLQKKR